MSFDIVRNGEAQKVNPPYGFKYLYMMDYAFNKLKIPCVYALIEADNLKSRRVLEKVGFHEDKPMTIDGVPHVQFKAIKPM